MSSGRNSPYAATTMDVGGQIFYALSGLCVFSERRGLEDRQSLLLGELLYWRRCEPSSPTGATVGLSEDAYNVVARVHKRAEGRDREYGGTHENDTEGFAVIGKLLRFLRNL